MPLSSLLQRLRQLATPGHGAAPEAVHVSQSDVEAARIRARRRLIGMIVLVGAGVIGFPWLFETEPRSMSQDVEMVQAQAGFGGADGGLSVARGASRSGAGNAAGKVEVAGIVPPPPERPAADERPVREPVEQEAISSRPPEAPVAKSEPKAPPAKEASAKPAAKPIAKATVKSAEKPLEKSNTRYVVQFGAFADAAAARTARMKVERLGVKTYAQQVDTAGGKRIRVRIGPFTDKAEADKAMATVRKAGLTGAVLTL